MAGRNKLSDEEKASRLLEKQQQPKRVYNKKTTTLVQENMAVTDNSKIVIIEDSKQAELQDSTNSTTEASNETITSTTNEDSKLNGQDQVNLEDVSLGANTNYKPFNGDTEERAYSSAQVNESITTPIEEEEIKLRDPVSAINSNNQSPNNSNIPANPALQGSNVSEADKQISAEQLTDLVLSGYDKLHGLGRWFVKQDEDDLDELQLEEKLDPNMQIPLDDKHGNPLTVKKFFQGFNSQIDEEFVLSPEFVKDVRPPLVRICIKNGWGVTDEQYVMYKFGEDLASKAAMVYAMKKTCNRMMKLFTIMYDKQKTALNNENMQTGKPDTEKNEVNAGENNKEDNK